MFEGENYSEPIYANVFCDYYQLKRLLNLDNSDLGIKIRDEVTAMFISKNGENIHIDLPDLLDDRRLDWEFPVQVILRKSINDDIPIQCFRLDN